MTELIFKLIWGNYKILTGKHKKHDISEGEQNVAEDFNSLLVSLLHLLQTL